MRLLAGCQVFKKTQNKKVSSGRKIQSCLTFSHFSMKYHAALGEQLKVQPRYNNKIKQSQKNRKEIQV